MQFSPSFGNKSIATGGVVAIIIGIVVAMGLFRSHTPAKNPDPNHTHADFAVWIYSNKVDFSTPKYMSAHDTASGHIQLNKYLHLHDENPNVLHSHKPGLTFGDFLTSLGLSSHDGCITVNGDETCASYNYQWRFIVNGKDLSVPGDDNDLEKDIGATLQKAYGYVFADDDKILLSLADIKGADGIAWQEWKDMTDDACLYSRTCPWRGEAPTEGCVSDPDVPCRE